MSDPAVAFEVHALGIEHSSTIGAIMGALADAQGEVENAQKAGTNPFFNGNKYATLASIYDACRGALSKNGIAVVQAPFNAGSDIGVTTLLGHKSGEWMRSSLAVKPAKFDAQGAGSAITYLRRYSLAAMVGVAPEDDDGNAAVHQPDHKPAAKPATKPTIVKSDTKAAPKPAEPPVDPQTGEVSPHALVIGKDGDGKVNWIGFAAEFAAALDSSHTLQEGEAWVLFNQPALDDCKKASVKFHGRIQEKIEAMRTRMAKTVESLV